MLQKARGVSQKASQRGFEYLECTKVEKETDLTLKGKSAEIMYLKPSYLVSM